VSDSQSADVHVKEVNQAPVISEIPDQVVNLSEDPELSILIPASDPDFPAGTLTYVLGSGVPPGVEIDSHTGRLKWRPTKEQSGQTFLIPIEVFDDSPSPLRACQSFRVCVVSPDPWTLAAKTLKNSVYLLTAQQPQGQTAYPYGTACAIRADTLLTSAVLAVELERRRRAGWRILAAQPAETQQLESPSIEVTDIRVHQGYMALSKSPTEQIFFDLAILTTDRPLSSRPALRSLIVWRSASP
jgi:hypothetical protein